MSASMLTLGVLLQLHDRFSGPLQQAAGRLDGLSKHANKLIGVGVAMNAAALATSGLSDRMQGRLMGLADSVIALDDAAAKIRSMPGITEDAVSRVVNAGRRWSQQHTDTAEDYVDTSYMMLSAGLNEVQALAATSKALAIAKATMGNGAETADLLAVVYNNMGDKTRDATQEIGRMGDVLTKTQQIFQIKNMQQLGDGIKYGTAAALQARMPFNAFAATIGQLNNAGLQGSMAGTALMASLRELPTASKKLGFKVAYGQDGQLDFVTTLENIKAKFGDINKLTLGEQVRLQKAFGDEGARAVVLLARNMDDYRKNIDGVNDSLGATDEAQKKMESGAGQQMKIALNNWMEFKRVFGTEILPILKDALPAFKSLVQSIAGFANAHPGMVKFTLIVMAIGAVLSPVLSSLGGLVTILGVTIKFWPQIAAGASLASKWLTGLGRAALFIGRAFMLNPIGLAITAIALGAYLIYKNWDTLKKWFTSFFSWVGEKAGAMQRMLPSWMQSKTIISFADSMAGMGKPQAGMAPPVAGVNSGAQKIDAGGKLDITVTDDRVKVKNMQANDPRFGFNVDAGPMTVGAF